MSRLTVSQIAQLPEFQELLRQRRRIVIPLALLILVTYFGFILLIAFDPSSLGGTIGDGIVSLGIYAGLGLLLLSFVIVGVYIKLAGGPIKTLLMQIQQKAN